MTFPLGFAENSIQLVPDGTLIVHVLIVLVMVYVLNATLYKPINLILANREKRTKGRASESDEILQSVNEKLADYERSLRSARSDAYAFTEQERSEAVKQRQQKLTETRTQLAASVATEKQAIQRQADEARAALDVDSREIAAQIGSRVLKRSITSASLN